MTKEVFRSMKQCEMKFIIDENLLRTIAKRFKIDLSNDEEANRKLEDFIKEYMTTQIRITKEIQVKVTDKQ